MHLRLQYEFQIEFFSLAFLRSLEYRGEKDSSIGHSERNRAGLHLESVKARKSVYEYPSINLLVSYPNIVLLRRR